MSNLLTTNLGRYAIITAQKYLLQRRISRFFKRNIVIDWDRWRRGVSEFDLQTILGALNTIHDTEILELLQLLGTIGCLDFTIADMNIYVDSVNGSDETGTGSVSRPYQTLWFIPFLPKTIRHNVRIILLASIDITEGLTFQFNFEDSGTFSFVGQGNATVLEGGLTVNTVNSLNSSSGLHITPTAVYSAHRQLTWLRATSGIDSGNACPVFLDDNTAPEMVTLRIPISSINAGDTFEFIEPSIKVTVPYINIKCKSPEYCNDIGSRNSRVTIANMEITMLNDYSVNNLLIHNSGNMMIAFVKINGNTIGTSENFTIRSSINNGNPFDVDLDTYVNTDVANLFNDTSTFVPDMCGFILFGTIGSERVFVRQEARVYNMVTRHPCQMLNSAYLAYSAARWVELEFGNLVCDTVLTDGHVVLGEAGAFETNACIAYIHDCDCITSDNVISILGDSTLIVNNVSRSAPFLGGVTGYGLYFYSPGRVEIDSVPTNLNGSLGDIAWYTINPFGTSVHPGAYLSANDGQQSIVKRLA